MLRFAICIAVAIVITDTYAQKKNSEEDIGAQTFKMVKETMGIYQNAQLLKEVEAIGHSMEKYLGMSEPLKYYLVDTPEPNAFATSGGYVYVTRGLLAIVNTPDELAGIMAHELSHVVLKHSTKRMKAGIVPAILQLPIRLVGTLASPEVADLLNIPVGFASKAALAAYSRGQETAADEHGVGVAIQAGYKPYGLVDGLERLTTYVEFISGKPMEKNIFTDHPMTTKRVEKLTEILEKKGFKRTPYFEGTDMKVIEGLVYGQNPEEGILDSGRFIHPAIGLYFNFPAGWYAQNSPSSLELIAEDKQAAIVVTVDTTDATPEEAAKQTVEKLKKSGQKILEEEAYTRNGLSAYRIQVGDNSRSAELRWIKLTKGTVLKVVGITTSPKPNPEIITSMDSFRPSTGSDLSSFKYHTVALKDNSPGKTVASFVEGDNQSGKRAQLLEILNGVAAGRAVSNGKYVKTIHTSSLK
ncbi:M48 family metalloprotease [Chryseolinea sp. T2]|uniref:M48 family metalloprotease n=1 Tax=Chryseolinea sp. T2 TaxID=3129255 RepID=UPI003076CBE6